MSEMSAGYPKMFVPHSLKEKFTQQVMEMGKGTTFRAIAVFVKLPTGAVELIANYEEVMIKISYYLTAYDEEFKLITNPQVQIVGYMLV